MQKAGDPESSRMGNIRDGIISVKPAQKTAVIQPQRQKQRDFPKNRTPICPATPGHSTAESGMNSAAERGDSSGISDE